jgi:hypothetical protein
MTYQPPLIGSKLKLLNFHATSWPAAGGWVAILVVSSWSGWRCGSGGGEKAEANAPAPRSPGAAA